MRIVEGMYTKESQFGRPMTGYRLIAEAEFKAAGTMIDLCDFPFDSHALTLAVRSREAEEINGERRPAVSTCGNEKR